MMEHGVLLTLTNICCKFCFNKWHVFQHHPGFKSSNSQDLEWCESCNNFVFGLWQSWSGFGLMPASSLHAWTGSLGVGSLFLLTEQSFPPEHMKCMETAQRSCCGFIFMKTVVYAGCAVCLLNVYSWYGHAAAPWGCSEVFWVLELGFGLYCSARSAVKPGKESRNALKSYLGQNNFIWRWRKPEGSWNLLTCVGCIPHMVVNYYLWSVTMQQCAQTA